MERISKVRAVLLMLLFCMVIGFFALKLYDKQIIETGGKTDNMLTFTSLIRVKAARGDILDRNGNVLVSNRASYDLLINHEVLLAATGTNQYLYNLVKLCEARGIEYTDHFPITKERPFTYTITEQTAAWQKQFQQYLEERGNLDSDITAPLLIEKLRNKYKIPAEWTEEEARKVIGIYYELQIRQGNSLALYVFLPDAADDDLAAIMELNVPGLSVENSTVREYNTTYAAHILGYVGSMNAEQWEYYKTIDGYSMDSEVGQAGLESAYEEYLHGTDGWRVDVVDKDGNLVESYYKSEPKAGANVEISIDLNLQMAAEDSLKDLIEGLRAQEKGKDGWDAEGGAVVAMDVQTGQLLVCGSYPSYDLSRFFEDYEEISKNPLKPMYNRALHAAYPPGSTYKMSMVAAAIDSKIINSEYTLYDKGVFDEYDGFTVSCLAIKYGYSHGTINAAEALRDSCNYFFYKLGDMISLEAMDSTAKGLGLGEKTGVELWEEVGHRANPETKAALYEGEHKLWFVGDQILSAIGQSENRFSPIQLCVYASTLANQGKRYNVTFMNRVVSDDYRQLLAKNELSVASVMDMSDEAYNTIKQGMHMVCSDRLGTAYSTFGNYPIQVCAKTGTAQTGINGTSDHGAFVCFAPMDNPKIAIAVYLEKGGHGSTAAVVARNIMDLYFDVDEVGEVPIFENQLS